MSVAVPSVARIKEILVRHLKNRVEIHFAILFGSVVEAGSFRDLDIGVFVNRSEVPAASDLDYAFNLADKLETDVAYSVDVRVINDAPLGFRYNVSRGEVLIVNDAAMYYNFLERTWDEYFDFQPVAMQYLKELR